MKSRLFGGLLFMAMCMPGAALAQAGPWGNCHMTVQDAINDAISTGNPDVYIAPGVYVESLYVDGGDIRLIAASDKTCTSEAAPNTRPVTLWSAGGSTLTIINHDVTLINLEVTGGNAAIGGNIYTESDGHLTLVNSRVHGGFASQLGGGIALVDCGQIVVDRRSSVDDNIARSGGGIAVVANRCHRFNLEVQGGVRGNAADQQGGNVYLQAASMEITGQISDGFAVEEGGCIAAYDDSEIVAAGSAVYQCKTAQFNSRGGVLHLEKSQTYMYRSRFVEGRSEFGGIISAEDGSVVVAEDSFLTHGIADRRGGLVHAVDSTLQLIDSNASSGLGRYDGGGFYLDGSRLDLDGVTELGGNRADAGSGGAVFATANSVVEVMGHWYPQPEPNLPLEGVRLLSNRAHTGGGGFHITGNANLVGAGLVAADNFTSGPGGAINAEAGSVNLSRTVLQKNQAFYGGGVASSSGGWVLLRGGNCDPVAEGFPANRYCTEIRENVGYIGGGGYAQFGTMQLDRVGVIYNADETAEAMAILLGREGHLILRNVLVETHGSGDTTLRAVDLDAVIEAEHVTFGENATLKLESTTTGFFDRSVFGWGAGGLDGSAVHNGQVIGDCNVGRGAGFLVGSNNTHADPQFLITARGRHRLDPNSPALDRCWGSTSDDLDGEMRPVGNGDDSGAFEMP